MKVKAYLILVVFMLLCTSIDNVQKAQASGSSKGVAERAGAVSAQGAGGLVAAQETHSPAAPRPFEPLLLLLFGSTLFFIGTAIKLVLSRKLSPKSIRTMTSSK